MINKKRAFTLIELLVVIAVIGILATVVVSSLSKARFKAQATHVLGSIKAIDFAFQARSLDDNINVWWHENDFPSTNSWAAHIGNLIEIEELLNEFLPIAPDIPGAGDPVFTYAYDNDGDVFVDPADCFAVYNGNWSQWNSLRGVNLVIDAGADPDSDRYWDMFTYLDNHIDKGDGPYCGKMRADARYDRTNNGRNRYKYFRYGIDLDQRV